MAGGKTIQLFGLDVPVTDVPIVDGNEPFVEYKLEDGSILRVKSVATSVLRVDGQYLPDGNPVYLVMTNPVVNVVSSPLKKSEKQPARES